MLTKEAERVYICFSCKKEKTAKITESNRNKDKGWWRFITCDACIYGPLKKEKENAQ